MVQRHTEHRYTVEEYLDLEEESLEKHEYYQGQIYLMAGGEPEHALIAGNTIGAFTVALQGKGCSIFTSDLLIRVETKSHYTYADATVVCGRPEYERIKKRRMLTNPALLVEVLSPSTKDYDRGTKFQLYKALDSFQDYLLIDSRQMHVQHYRKLDENTWQEKTYTQPDQTIIIENLDVSLSLQELYRNVEFETEAEPILRLPYPED
jgi:Uma2 family endonuclease